MNTQAGRVDIAGAIRRTLARDPALPCLEFEGRWISIGAIAALGDKLERLLTDHGIAKDMAVAIIARNRPACFAAMAGLFAHARAVSLIYPLQAPAAFARDIRALKVAAVVAVSEDWTDITVAAARETGTLAIDVSADLDVRVAVPLAGGRVDPARTYHRLPEPGIEMLSSGTTGPPKRIFHHMGALARSVASISDAGASPLDAPPDTLFWPLGHSGGVNQLIAGMVRGKRVAMLEKFTVAGFVDLAKRHRIPGAAMTPTMLRMFAEADIAKEDVASVKAIYGGSAAVDMKVVDQVEARYGIAVLWALGASEFCGSVCSWTLDLKKQFGAAKRGSSGRVMPGVELRVVDIETGAVVPPGKEGLLEARIPEVRPDWIHTTDLVLIDEDGFLFHLGRRDGAIIRGGFKILPEKINEALRLHPAVDDAAVIPMPHDRLGQVPVAAVKIRAGFAAPSDRDLDEHARQHLTLPEVPVQFIIVDEMPYTSALKADLGAIRRIAEQHAKTA
jgi:acyl-CoA synthetase (AMP-forming)/AMP-acid ligase II